MISRKGNRIYQILIFVCGIAVLIPAIFIVSSDRQSLIDYMLKHLQRSYLSSILQQRIITPEKFEIIKFSAYALIVADAALILALHYFRNKVQRRLQFVLYSLNGAIQSLIFVFKSSRKKENIIFATTLIFLIARGLYYIIASDLQYDEMWCFNYYTSRPLYLTVFSYANYPLYEMITHVFKWLPFSMKINLRLPSLMAGILTCVIMYACTKKITRNFMTALACMVLFATMPFSTCYMLYGKGVSVELFFAVISFFCGLFFLREIESKKYLLLFGIANVAGMYAMPTHVYFWLLQLAFGLTYILMYKRDLLRLFLIGNVFVLFFTICCYLPVLVGSGISFVTNAAWGYNSWPGITAFLKYISYAFTGSSYGFVLAFLPAAVVLTIIKKNRKVYFFLLCFGLALLILPVPIRVFQHIYIPERAVAFIGLIIPLFVFIVFRHIINSYWQTAVLITISAFMCVISHFHPFRFWSASSDKNAIEISALLMKRHVSTCYDNAPASHFFYYYPALEYYYNQNKMKIDISMAASNSLRYRAFSLADQYDCIIESTSDSKGVKLADYETVYRDPSEGYEILVRMAK